MTVKELREGLAPYDDDTLVFLDDWTNGYAPTSWFSVTDHPIEDQQREIDKWLVGVEPNSERELELKHERNQLRPAVILG